MSDFFLKVGDRLPLFRVTLKDGNGDAVDLTGCTVAFSMREQGSATKKITAAAATVITAASGIVEYTWAALDVDAAGTYLCEWRVTTGAGKVQTIPNDGTDRVVITVAV